MLIVILASTVSTEILTTFLQRPVVDLILHSEEIPINNIVGWLLFNYPLEVIGMAVLGTVLMIISVIAFLSISRIVQKNGFFESINASVLDLKKAAGLTLLFWLVFIILSGIVWVITFAGTILPILETILIIIFGAIIFVILVKLIFTIPVLIKKDLRKSLQESWKFTEKKFWKSVFFVIIALIISGVIALIIMQIGITLGESFELIFSAISEIISTTYFFAAITAFYYSKQ